MNNQNTILNTLKDYVIERIMEGDAEGLEDTSPLLSWGVLNSLEIVNLRVFVQESFGVVISDEDTNPTNFENLRCIAQLVHSLQDQKIAANA